MDKLHCNSKKTMNYSKDLKLSGGQKAVYFHIQKNVSNKESFVIKSIAKEWK